MREKNFTVDSTPALHLKLIELLTPFTEDLQGDHVTAKWVKFLCTQKGGKVVEKLHHKLVHMMHNFRVIVIRELDEKNPKEADRNSILGMVKIQ